MTDPMSYQLVSEEQYAGLSDDPEQCFVEFENICRQNMTRMLDDRDSSSFDRVVRQQYMAATAAVANECNVPNVTFVPSNEDNFYDNFSDFCHAVQAEVARIRVRQRGDRNTLSVLLTGNTRSKIEHYISRIRDMVDKSDMDFDRKKRLSDKLDELAKELTHQRLSFAKAMASLVAVTTILAGSVTIAAEGQSAVAHILHLIGQDKETEEAATRRLSPPPKALPSPKKPPAPAKRPAFGKAVAHRTAAVEDPDDIPF